MSGIKGGGWKTIVAGLALELVVVFIGVYGAAALSSHQERQRDEAHKDQIRHALVAEINDITHNTKSFACEEENVIQYYKSEFAAGHEPIPQAMITTVRVQQHIWQATLASGGLDLFDVPTFLKISDFYNELNQGFAYLDLMSRESEQQLLPIVGETASTYYDAARKLKPKYQWYFNNLKTIRDIAISASRKGDVLAAQLGDQHRSPPPPFACPKP